jgi:dipeptidyl aminopeptidase/acylaminoacyl peptidase
MHRPALVAIAWFVATTFAFPQNSRHPFTIDDAAALHSASAVAISPDGKNILYAVRFGAAKGPITTEWHLIAAAGGESRKLSIPDKFKPAGFTRDGSLYGTYEVGKTPQLATFPIAAENTAAAAAAAPVPLTSLPRGIHSTAISPDGSRYAILADPRLPDPLEDVHTVIEAEPTSLYVIAADGKGGTWWCPALKDVAEVAWSQDGSSLAVMSTTPKIGFHYVKSFIDICNADGPRHVATINNAVQGIGWINGNGGSDLAFLSTNTSVLTPDHVWTVSAAGGTPVDRTPTLQASALGLSVDAHGNVWVDVAHGVHTEIDSFQNNSLTRVYTWPDGTINGIVAPQLASTPDVRVLTVADPQHASNLAIPHDTALQRITNEGEEQLAKIDLGETRVVHWTSKEGIALEGIVFFPSNYEKGKAFPFLVMPHGGPEANDTFRLDFFARTIAGMGYVVLQPEYRGSTGYGSDFMNAIYQHFGDRAYRDVDSATDYAIAQGWADPNHLAIFGWSAGGFMTSWTVTQTHRYKAAIEGAGITDWLTFIWTSDVQQIDYDARWTDKDPNAFFAFSAMMHADDVTTPLLVLHGAADERVPTYQGREYFEILAAKGKTTRMVTYPGSPHFPTVWEQRLDVFHEVAAWLAKYNP